MRDFVVLSVGEEGQTTNGKQMEGSQSANRTRKKAKDDRQRNERRDDRSPCPLLGVHSTAEHLGEAKEDSPVAIASTLTDSSRGKDEGCSRLVERDEASASVHESEVGWDELQLTSVDSCH